MKDFLVFCEEGSKRVLHEGINLPLRLKFPLIATEEQPKVEARWIVSYGLSHLGVKMAHPKDEEDDLACHDTKKHDQLNLLWKLD